MMWCTPDTLCTASRSIGLTPLCSSVKNLCLSMFGSMAAGQNRGTNGWTALAPSCWRSTFLPSLPQTPSWQQQLIYSIAVWPFRAARSGREGASRNTVKFSQNRCPAMSWDSSDPTRATEAGEQLLADWAHQAVSWAGTSNKAQQHPVQAGLWLGSHGRTGIVPLCPGLVIPCPTASTFVPLWYRKGTNKLEWVQQVPPRRLVAGALALREEGLKAGTRPASR